MRLVVNGVQDVITPSLPLSPTFTYYLPQSLVLSAVLPVGGPVAGGTIVTVTGIGFAPLTTSATAGPRCLFGQLGPVEASIVAGSLCGRSCVPPGWRYYTVKNLSHRAQA